MARIIAQAFLTELRVDTVDCDKETMMKRFILPLLFVVIAQSAFAGLTYKVESVSSGVREGTISGSVEVEGKSSRFNIEHGDGMVLPDASFIISSDGGKTLSVVTPASKTYFEFALDQATGIGSAMVGVLKIQVANPQMSVKDLGAGDKIEGYATQKKSIDVSYDMNIDMGGQPMTMKMSTSTQAWVTDQIPMESASFLQTGELHTGFDEVDKLIAAQAKAVTGFPLKQITTILMTQGESKMQVKTTTTVSGLQKKPIAASEFVIPAGFTKTDSPMEKMMKSMAGGGAPQH